jgi:DNA-binding transcriptional ArsR family regulator
VDVLVWFQLLDFAKTQDKPIIFITDEMGEDWCLKDDRKTLGPRPELLQEMHKEAGRWFYMYATERFLQYSKDLLELEIKPNVIKEAQKIKAENEETQLVSGNIIEAWEALKRRDELALPAAAEAIDRTGGPTLPDFSCLAVVFKVLANDTRLRLLHAIVRADQVCVTDLATAVGMKPQAVSNQLQRLADLGILTHRREGKSIIYRLVDPCVMTLLDQGLCLMEEASARRGGTGRANSCCGD